VREPVRASVLLCLLFLAAAVPLIVLGYDRGRGAADQNQFHLVAIRTFARQWPHFDFSGYASATTPGYHLILAAFDRYVSDSERVLRLLGALFTVGLLATLAAAVARRTGAAAAVVLCLPAVCSLYVFSSGAWLLPDNAAWWVVLALLLLAMRPKVDGHTYLAGGLLLLLLVVFRQVHVWMAGVLCLSAWMGQSDRLWPHDQAAGTDALARRSTRALLMALAAVPAVIVLLSFFRLWHGTTPPSFQTAGTNNPSVIGGNPAVPATVLSIFGFVSLFYLCWLLSALRAAERRVVALLVLGGLVVGLIAGLVPHTSYNPAQGRWSGIWNLLKPLPTYHERSPAIIALSALGGAMLGAWLAALGRRDRWIFAAAWAGFIASQTVGALAWQRYYEPFVLIALPLMASRLPAGRDHRSISLSRAAPLALAVLLAAITLQGLGLVFRHAMR